MKLRNVPTPIGEPLKIAKNRWRKQIHLMCKANGYNRSECDYWIQDNGENRRAVYVCVDKTEDNGQEACLVITAFWMADPKINYSN